jgi:ParB family transcriptional regulator, chromosome partitioning protein
VSGNSDACTDPNCYAAKLEAHVKAKVAAKPELVQISTAYKQQSDGEKAIPRNKYVEIREEKPDTPEKAKRPEFKTCKYTTEAIVADGIDKGELRKVCTEPTCPVHHPTKQPTKEDASFKAEQEKRRREEALANATGIRVLQSIVSAVPVRLMKRDLLFVVEQLLPLLDEKRLEMAARNRNIKAKEGESVAKLLTAFIRKADEGTIGKLVIESVILLSARSQSDGGKVLRAAAQAYGVDTDAVALKVKQEFGAKEKARKATKPEAKPTAKAKRAA